MNKIILNTKSFVLMAIIGIMALGCEKNSDDLQIEKQDNNIAEYVDYSWYTSNREAAPQDDDDVVVEGWGLPYRWVSGGLGSTTIVLDNDGGDCLKTTNGDCFPEVVVAGIVASRSVNTSEINIADYYEFLSYEDKLLYFINEDWQNLLPMLKQNTVDLLIDGDLSLVNTYNESKKLAYFRFVPSNDHETTLFVIQLKITE